jgi:hypothetical protein
MASPWRVTLRGLRRLRQNRAGYLPRLSGGRVGMGRCVHGGDGGGGGIGIGNSSTSSFEPIAVILTKQRAMRRTDVWLFRS